MSGTIDLQKLETFIRVTRPQVTINEHHKRRLRNELLSESVQKPVFPLRWILVGTVSGLAVILFMIFVFQKPIVGIAEWSPSRGTPEFIRADKVYETGDSTLVVTLAENTRMQFSPHSIFSIVSNFTDRKHEKSVVYIAQGELLAYVFVHKEYPLLVRTPDVEVKVTGTRFRICVIASKNR